MTEKKKQWTTEEVGILIDTYREHANLWDPKNMCYKNRIKKMDSYKEIASVFKTTTLEIERKIKNIMSQYQRQRPNPVPVLSTLFSSFFYRMQYKPSTRHDEKVIFTAQHVNTENTVCPVEMSKNFN